MSASYIHRDPLVLSPAALQLISKNGTIGCPSDSFMVSSGRSYLDRPVSSSSPSNGITKPSLSATQVSIQSPKMSPDSTLTHYHPPSTTIPSSITHVSRFASSTSPGSSGSGLGQCASSCASSSSSSVGDGFLRSALATSNVITDNPNTGCLKINTVGLSDSHAVGSSTGNNLSELSSMSSTAKVDVNSAAMMAMMMRPRAMTVASNLARSITSTKNVSSSAAATSVVPINTPAPSSTTPVKKSSRRNPWGSETYSDLISIAIHSYPDQQATLQQIYDFIISNYEYFRERSDPTSSAGWKNSIRHNLSLHDRFTKCPKSSDNTKSSYWRINTEVASKPYVRRRACSMDANNLKRSGGNHCGKAGSRAGGGSHRGGMHQHSSGDKMGSRLGSMMPPLNEVHDGPILTPLMTPSDAIQQSRPDSQHPNGSRHNSARSAFTKTYLGGANKLPSYFSYPTTTAPGLTLGKPEQTDQPGAQNGIPGRWATPKPTQTAFHPSGYPNPSPSSYMYDHGSGNFGFESSDFSSILGSTDQALVRSRASGLIEQLLCSDHPMGAMLSNGKPAPSVRSPQSTASASYLPNSFMVSNSLVSSMSTPNGQNAMSIDTISSFTPNSLMPHSSAVDLRPHTGSLLSERSNDARSGHSQHHQLQQQQHHHHLRPVPMQNCSSGADMMTNSAFSTPWNPYIPQFHLPSSAGHGSAMSGGGLHNMNYSVFNGNGSFHSQPGSQQLSESKVKYDSIETMASGNHPHGSLQQQQQQRLPFLSGPHMAPISSATGNSNGSSATTWSVGVSQHSDTHRIGSVPPCNSGGSLTPLPSAASPGSTQSTTTTGHDSRSLGPPVTPPNPLYYSPMRQSLSSMYGSSDCALDTPPYHQQSQQQTQQSPSMKPDQMDMMDSNSLVATASTVVSSAGTTDYDTSQTSSATRHSTYTTNCSGGVGLRTRSDADADSEMSARYADTYSYDDDCEPLELELSLELADRIVGSTRSDAKP